MWHRHRSLGSRSHKTIRHMKNSEESLISQSYMPGTPGTPSPRQPLRHWKATPASSLRFRKTCHIRRIRGQKGHWDFAKTRSSAVAGTKALKESSQRKLNCLFKEKIPKGSDRLTPKTTQHGTSPQLQLTKQCRRK